MTLEEFNKKYIYRNDKEKFGFIEVWEIPELQEGIYYGDCESYCLFLKKNVPEFKDWDYYFCKFDGNGHCILYKNGDVIDCNIRDIVTIEQYSRIFKISDIRKYSWFEIFSKRLFAKGFLLWKKLSGR